MVIEDRSEREQTRGEAWHSSSSEHALNLLDTSKEGLPAKEAARRLELNGPNELKQGKQIRALQILAGQFKSLIIWILIAAGIVSGLLGQRMDAIAILAIVALNAAIGFYQEFRAGQSIALGTIPLSILEGTKIIRHINKGIKK